jgi:hypothetical protein
LTLMAQDDLKMTMDSHVTLPSLDTITFVLTDSDVMCALHEVKHYVDDGMECVSVTFVGFGESKIYNL